jgi:hypothetical protein
MDDFLLSTPNDEDGTEYRSSVADMTAHVQWQKQLAGSLPAGSDIK